MARRCCTICLPIGQESYRALVADPARFRAWIDAAFAECPELFPEAFAEGYALKDERTSAKTGLTIRRVECHADGRACSVRPSFVRPYHVGLTDDVEKPLFLRRFGVPFWAIARVFGKDPSYWYRLEVSLGRNSLVGTTVRKADLPRHLVADEHHQRHGGQKVFIATVVAEGCCLGACVVDAADEAGLTCGYGAFEEEALDVEPDYSPQTVNVDGRAATRLAWLGLFPLVAVLRCFLHGWLSIRDGCKKHPLFSTLSESAALDRVMRSMNGYWVGCQRMHGSDEAAELHSRAWALLHNFSPYSPQAIRADGGQWRSPAERLNRHRYHDNWLHNLLVSASLGGFRHRAAPPHNPA